jgi:excisionase family DNA binding protein
MTEALNRMYYSRREAARLLNLSLRTTAELIATGRLVSVKVGGRRLVHRDSLESLGGRSIVAKMPFM